MQWLLPMLILTPVLCAGISLVLRSARTVLWFCAAGTLAGAGLAMTVSVMVFQQGTALAARDWLMLDALSAYHIMVMMPVWALSALHAVSYFQREIAQGELTPRLARHYGGLWFGAQAAMMLVLVSNNIGIMWVGIEATTLLTAFLICIHICAGALEAMWKYLVMCSVGVAMAFTGTILIAASTGSAGLHGTDALLWTQLREMVLQLDPALFKAGFIFLVIGYGTKAGLAPMHNWLPDAHSQAPAPVSAVFSGVLLNTALYCILRCLPLAEAVTGNTGWAREILVVAGLLSIGVAAAFIGAQRDVKRLLAYSSVEHIGVMVLGIGLGGLGALAGLLHMLNHALSKSLAFVCAGRLGQVYGTHEMRHMTGMLRSAPVWGSGLIGGLLALIGTAPLAIFLSEFLILKAAVDSSRWWVVGLFLAGLAVVFVGALRHVVPMAWGPSPPAMPRMQATLLERVLVFGPLAVILVLGVWLPQPLLNMLTAAAQTLAGGLP